PAVAAAKRDELLAFHQAVADLLDLMDGEANGRGDGRGGEFGAAHGRDLQHAPFLDGEVFDLLTHQDLHAVGDGKTDLRYLPGEPPNAVVLQRATARQIVGQRHDEQRVAAGPCVYELRELAQLDRFQCEAPLQIERNIVLAKKAQRQLRA